MYGLSRPTPSRRPDPLPVILHGNRPLQTVNNQFLMIILHILGDRMVHSEYCSVPWHLSPSKISQADCTWWWMVHSDCYTRHTNEVFVRCPLSWPIIICTIQILINLNIQSKGQDHYLLLETHHVMSYIIVTVNHSWPNTMCGQIVHCWQLHANHSFDMKPHSISVLEQFLLCNIHREPFCH